MKVRPQFQLRFLSRKQYAAIRSLAKGDGISINEWIVRLFEERLSEHPVVHENTESV